MGGWGDWGASRGSRSRSKARRGHLTILTSIGFVLGFGHARPLRTDRMEQAYVLLDASAPLDVKLLERTVETFYNAGGKEEVSETPGVRERHDLHWERLLFEEEEMADRKRGRM